MPSISVVIPVYNGEQTIRETIESILNQTFCDLEVIVINDGSQDSTLDTVKSIPDPRLQVFSYTNAGLATSRNRGIFHAAGDYISFIDADDLWTPDKLDSQFQALQQHPQAALAYSWTDYIDESSQFIRRGSHAQPHGNVYSHLLLNNFIENGSNPLIRKQALIEIGGFDETLKAAEDWDLYLRLAARYPVVVVPLPQILYRESRHSMTTNVVRQEKETLKVIEKAFIQAPETLQPLKKISLANLYKYLLFKSLENTNQRASQTLSLRFLYQTVFNQPFLLRTRYFWTLLIKIMLLTLLPPKQSQFLIKKLNQRFNFNPLPNFQHEPF